MTAEKSAPATWCRERVLDNEYKHNYTVEQSISLNVRALQRAQRENAALKQVLGDLQQERQLTGKLAVPGESVVVLLSFLHRIQMSLLELKPNPWPGLKSEPNTTADERKRQLLQELAKVLE